MMGKLTKHFAFLGARSTLKLTTLCTCIRSSMLLNLIWVLGMGVAKGLEGTT